MFPNFFESFFDINRFYFFAEIDCGKYKKRGKNYVQINQERQRPMNKRHFLEIDEEGSGIPASHRAGNKQEDKERYAAGPAAKGFTYKIIKLFKQAVFSKYKPDKNCREIAYQIAEQVIYYRIIGQKIKYCADGIRKNKHAKQNI